MNKSDEVFNAQLAEEAVKRTAKLNDATIDLAIRLKEAREFMAWSVAHVRGIWLDWEKEASGACRQMTEFRMAFERESKALVGTGKDVATFFNSPEYLRALGNLNDTMSLLERFAKLKADGTLDAFADFILKVSCK